ncbi:MAG: methyltransferase domain-containing protein [Actinomycetota bacterium]|nr:methyltransferase domain-containing protein [Actinomycetota bacterium]
MNRWNPEATGHFLEHYETLRGVVRLELMDRQLSEHLGEPPARICDVGGGAGHNSIPLARRGYEVEILDPFEEMLQKARQTLDAEEEAVRGSVELVGGNGEDAPRIFGSETFDAVLCHLVSRGQVQEGETVVVPGVGGGGGRTSVHWGFF